MDKQEIIFASPHRFAGSRLCQDAGNGRALRAAAATLDLPINDE